MILAVGSHEEDSEGGVDGCDFFYSGVDQKPEGNGQAIGKYGRGERI